MVSVGGVVPIPMIRERIEACAVVGSAPMTKTVDAMVDELRTWHGALRRGRAERGGPSGFGAAGTGRF